MKNEISLKNAAVALVLAFVLAFSMPVSMVSHVVSQNTSSSSGGVTADIQTLSVENEIQPQEQQTVITPSVNTDDYKEEETMPGNDTVLSPDEILPDENSGVTEMPTDDAAADVQEGVTVVPAKLNNIMRDSLANIISKKIYTFTADRRSAVVYAFNHVNVTDTSCLWYITLYEEYSPDGTGKTTAYRVLNRMSYTSIGVGERSATIGILPGNYRVEVECITGYTEDKYDIVIGLTETNDYETEYNNSPSRYTELPLNKTLHGSASVFPGDEPDEDYYLFRVTDAGYTVLYFDHEEDTEGMNGAVAWRIRVTDMQGNEYYYISSDMDKAMINSGVMGLPPGYYYVRVSSHVFSNITYSLNVSFSKDSAIETELNDTPESADIIAVNTEKIGSLTPREDKSDRDYYVFTMEKDGFVVIDFIHEALTESNDGWNITVTAQDGRVAYNTVSDWNQPVLQSPSIGLTAGTYYIGIDSDNLYHSSIVYRLILLTVESSGWETEPNNSMDTADVIGIGSTVNGTMVEMGTDYDKDYFMLDIEVAGTLSIAFGHIVVDEPDKEGWIVSVADADGNIISSMTSDWDSPAEVLTAPVEAGRYYIVVETGLYFNTSRYVFATVLE